MIILFELIETTLQFYEPIIDFIEAYKRKTFDHVKLDLIIFCLRNPLDGVGALGLLYIGYALAMKLQRAKAKRSSRATTHQNTSKHS
jgi:hypothetical protein